MRDFDAATLAALASGNIVAHRLVRIEARNLSTGLTEALGLWSGDFDLTFFLSGVGIASFTGVGALLEPDPITAAPGLSVRVHQLRASAVAPEVEAAVKGYETRFAPVTIYRLFLDPETRNFVSSPTRVFRGLIDRLDFPRAAPGEEPACVIDLVSEARHLTRSLAVKKSDESQKARGGDRLRRYGNVSGSVPVYWGELRAAPAAAPAEGSAAVQGDG